MRIWNFKTSTVVIKQKRKDQQGRAPFKIAQPPQHLKMGTNKGMGQETYNQTNRAGSKLETMKIINVLEHHLGN